MGSSLRAGRAGGAEILDQGGLADAELRGTLADLRRYNAWFGGARLAIREVGRVLKASGSPSRVSLLDVATGSADIPRALVRWGAARAIEVVPDGVDLSGAVLREARRVGAADTDEGGGRRGTGARLVQAHACRLPHADGAFDLALCCNFMHHLGDAEAVAAIREMRRVSRLGIVVVDLIRSRAALALVWLATRSTTSNQATRHDGTMSIRNAFTPRELGRLAERAGLQGAVVRRAGPVRMSLSWTARGGRAS